jgi:hypothetical protein
VVTEHAPDLAGVVIVVDVPLAFRHLIATRITRSCKQLDHLVAANAVPKAASLDCLAVLTSGDDRLAVLVEHVNREHPLAVHALFVSVDDVRPALEWAGLSPRLDVVLVRLAVGLTVASISAAINYAWPSVMANPLEGLVVVPSALPLGVVDRFTAFDVAGSCNHADDLLAWVDVSIVPGQEVIPPSELIHSG